ncbi:MAG: RNA polymerase sigma factor [Candidatus Pacearchaeota archaeon]
MEHDLDNLYRTYNARLVNFARRIIGSRDDAEEVVSDSWLHILSATKRREDISLNGQYVSTFLHSVVKNASYDFLRSKPRVMSTEDLSERVCLLESPDRNSTRTDINDVLASLSDEHREILILRYSSGISIKDVAAGTGIMSGTVKSRTYRACQAFCELYGDL